MATKSSCSLNSLADRKSLPNNTVTVLLKTLSCYSQAQSFCQTEGGLEFCTANTEVKCGSESTPSNRTIPPVKCNCLGLETCFCSFGCSISLLLLIAYLGFFVFAQIYHSKYRKMSSKILKPFDVKLNWMKIFSPVIPGESLSCLNWLRDLNTVSVILGHFHQIISMVYSNPEDKHSFFSMLLLHNMNMAVETFLLFGGLLLGYTWTLKLKASKGPLKRNFQFWFRYWFARWYRLAPPLLVMMMISNVYGHMVLPELWMGSSDPGMDCPSTWPTMLTLTNNYFPNTCMRWLWYLGIDIQLYAVGGLLLAAQEKFGPRKILCFSMLLIFMSLIYRAYLSYVFEIPIMYLADAPVWEPIMQEIYVKPFPRISSYLIGLALGANLDAAVDFVGATKQVRVKITLGACVLLAYAYFGGFYEYFFDVDSIHRVVYLSIFRTVFTTGIAWFALMCTSRHVQFFNRLNLYHFWAPVAKVSFAAYLLHPLIIGGVIQKLLYSFVPLTMNIDLVVLFGGCFIVCLVLSVSLVFSLVFELPLAGLRPLAESQIVRVVFRTEKATDEQKKQ